MISTPPSDEIAAAARHLREGRLVAFPTETVYGLGADATNDRAVASIFEAKGRPRFNPLIIHVSNVALARAIASFDARAERLAALFWPGPLSLVLPRPAGSPISLLASAGLDSLALRVPDHPTALDLLTAAGLPIAAPSANRSGRVSPTTAAHVRDELGDRIAAVLDGGACRVGLESTVLDLTSRIPTILRHGGITRTELEAVIGPLDEALEDDTSPRAPGMLSSHYAPSLSVRLNARDARPGEAFMAFRDEPPTGFAEVAWLSRSGDLQEAAAKLFALLRSLDRAAFSGIAVAPIPETGLGAAINDRLRRAAAPRT